MLLKVCLVVKWGAKKSQLIVWKLCLSRGQFLAKFVPYAKLFDSFFSGEEVKHQLMENLHKHLWLRGPQWSSGLAREDCQNCRGQGSAVQIPPLSFSFTSISFSDRPSNRLANLSEA